MEDRTHSFGYWLRRRRKALDLTQEALAQRVFCSGFSIRKIEADERRPSRRLAERLAAALAIAAEDRLHFLEVARAARTTEDLRLDAAPVDADAPLTTGERTPGTFDSSPRTAGDASPFVGRGQEFGQLSGLIARLAHGLGGHAGLGVGAGAVSAGHIVLIEGEPGIGKSRLMREVARHAQVNDLPTLATRCFEIERATPYQPIIDLITRALERLSVPALRRLAPVSLAELAALVPEIGERVPGLPQLSNDFPAARQARLPHAVGQLLEALRGDRPFLLMVDDLQWADEASAQVLHYLARQAAERPMLVMYAYRDDEVDTQERFARLIESLCRDASAQRMLLPRLNSTDTSSLVAALAEPAQRPQGLAARLHLETEGNPFFLLSILQSLSEGETPLESLAGVAPALLPDALRAAVRVRLAHVPTELRPLLEIAAVLGRRFDFDTLLDVTGEPEEELLNALEGLVKRRLLREETEGGIYDFSHDKLREVAYRDIGGTRRRLLHRTVAEAMERRGADEAHERSDQLAEHYDRAQVWSKALRYLVMAAERSQALFAMRDALHWLDRAVALSEAHPRALSEAERLAIYERRGAARAHAGQTQGAVDDIRRVVQAARSGGEREKTRDALVQLGMAYRRADAYEQATQCLTEALAESRAMHDVRRTADTLYHLGTVTWSRGVNHEAIRFHQEAVEICARAGFADLVAVQAYHGRGEAHYASAEPEAAIDCFTRSLELARGVGDKSYEAENLMMIGHSCVGTKGLGDYSRAMTNLEAALDIAHTADLQWHRGPILLGIDHVRACTGHYGAAWSGMQTTLQWLEGLEQPRYQLIAHDFIGHLLLDLGLNELAVQHLQRGLDLGRDTGIMFWRAAILANMAVAKARLGQGELVAELQAALERTRAASERYLMVRCLDALAEIALAAGDANLCRAYGDELLAIAELNGLRELEAVARRWRGAALLGQQAYRDARAELAQAATLADEIGRVRLQMETHAALARVFDGLGQGKDSQRHDLKARAFAEAIQASAASTGLEVRLAELLR